ncbi:MAG TPA: MFS transporter [Ktedonobacterales bacterium]|nr:MFS transporter [Ktedonobacterales bacterium]
MARVPPSPPVPQTSHEAMNRPVLSAGPLRRAIRPYLGYSRNVYLLLLFTLGKGIQLSIGLVVTNLYAYSVGYRQDFIGVLAAAPSLGALLAAVPMGFLADRVFRTHRKPLLLVTGILNPLALAGIGLTASAPVMLASSFANGILSSAYWVTNIPMLTESVAPQERVRVMSLNSFLLLGIGAVGGLIGGLVPEGVSLLLHMPATSPIPLRWGVISAALAVLLPTAPLAFLRERHEDDSTALSTVTAGATPPVASDVNPMAAFSPQSGEASITPAFANAGRLAIPLLFAALLIPDLLFTTGEGAVAGLLQLFFRLRYLLEPGALGAFSAGAGLLCGVMALVAPPIARRLGKLRAITVVVTLSAPTMLVIGFAPTLALSMSAEYLRNILRGVFDPIYATFAMERVSARSRATLSGFYSLTWSIGYSVGPSLAGWLQANVSLSASFAVGAGCLLLGISLLYGVFRRVAGANS